MKLLLMNIGSKAILYHKSPLIEARLLGNRKKPSGGPEAGD
jgi:hypothetical protein